MSIQFEPDEIGKIPFRDVLKAVMPAIKSKIFTSIDYGELTLYGNLIQYKVQKDFFDLIEETAPGTIDLENFILIMRGRPKLQDCCMEVICRKLETAFFQYDFTVSKADLSPYDDIPDGGMMRGARLFSDSEALMLASLFSFFAEQTHFNHLRETMRPDYTWMEYFFDLRRDRKLWMEVLTAFRNTILTLDFKDIWQEVDIGLEE